MIRKLAAVLLLSLATLAPAEEATVFTVTLDAPGPVEVVAHELVFPDEYVGPVAMAVDLRLPSGEVRSFHFEVPAAARDWHPGYVSHSHHFVAAGRNWYVGEQALWDGVKLHVEPRVFLPQVRLTAAGDALEVFIDSEIFEQIYPDQRRREAFAALHADA